MAGRLGEHPLHRLLDSKEHVVNVIQRNRARALHWTVQPSKGARGPKVELDAFSRSFLSPKVTNLGESVPSSSSSKGLGLPMSSTGS